MSEISTTLEINVHEAIDDLISRYVNIPGEEELLVLRHLPTIFDDYMCFDNGDIDHNKSVCYQLISVPLANPVNLSRMILSPSSPYLMQQLSLPVPKSIQVHYNYPVQRIGIVVSGKNAGRVYVAEKQDDNTTNNGMSAYMLSGRYYALGILYAIVASSCDLDKSFDVILCCSQHMTPKVQEMLDAGCRLIYDDTQQLVYDNQPMFSDPSIFDLVPGQPEFAVPGQMLPFTPVMDDRSVNSETSDIFKNHWMSRRVSAFRGMCADVLRPLGVSVTSRVSLEDLLDLVLLVSNQHETGFEYLRGWIDSGKYPSTSLEYKHLREKVPDISFIDIRNRLRDVIRIWYAIGQECQVSFNLADNSGSWHKVKTVRDALGIDHAIDSYYAKVPLSMIIGEDAAFSETIGQWMV